MTKRDALNARLGDKAGAFAELTEEQAGVLLAAFAETPADRPVVKDEAAAFAETPYAKAMAAKIEALEGQRAADAKAARKKDAAQFAKDRVASGHIVPANLAVFTELIERALEDDATTPAVVTFSHDGAASQGGRTEALLALVAAQPKTSGAGAVMEAIENGTLAERFSMFANGDGKATGGNAETPEQRKARLLGMTDVGRAALKAAR